MSHDDRRDDEKNPPQPDPSEELRAAFSHFKSAAQLWFQRASEDPTLKGVASEAEKAVQKFGETAEPIARQIAEQITKVAGQVTESVESAVSKRKRPATKEPKSEPESKAKEPK